MNSEKLLQHIQNIRDWLPAWSKWLGPGRAAVLEIPADLKVEKSGVSFVDGQGELDYLWYQLREVDARRRTHDRERIRRRGRKEAQPEHDVAHMCYAGIRNNSFYVGGCCLL